MKKVICAVLSVSLVVALGCANKAGMQAKQEVGAQESIVILDEVHSTMLSYIVDHMDKYDKEKMVFAFEHANPNTPFEWENPQTGKKYHVIMYSGDVGKEKKCNNVEIFSAEKRLRACADIKKDPAKGWLMKSQKK